MHKGIHHTKNTKATKATKATVVRLSNLMSSQRSNNLTFSFRCCKTSPCEDHFVERLEFGKQLAYLLDPVYSADCKRFQIGKGHLLLPLKMVASGSNPAVMDHSFGTKFFSAGLAACFADLVTFPLDTAKVRLQIQGETGGKTGKLGVSSKAVEQVYKYKGPIGTIRVIIREEGARGLYNGIVPGLQRQMCFASIRIGSYDVFRDYYMKLYKNNPKKPSFIARMSAGITTGALAIIVAQPTDVVKVRMQAQRAGVPARYNGTLHAYRTIAVTEGIRGLWKGMIPNIARNVVVNCSELVTYDIVKDFILSRNLLNDTLPCHFVSAFGAGFCATVVASPVDVVKTRFMNSNQGQYKGVLDCAGKMYREGGLIAFYKGFFPSFLRLGSWNIVMFISYEQLKRFISANRQVLVH